MNDDAQLIDEALAGRSVAFGQLVTKYQDRLYNALVHVIGSTEEARDVVQDAFVQAFMKLGSFHRSSAFYTWLYRIAFNVAISRRRRRKPTASIEQSPRSVGARTRGPRPVPLPSGSNGKSGSTQVQAALAAMSEEHRAVLVLREMDGLCYETIAEVLDLPVGTVRSRLHRARLELREQLKEVLQEEEL